MASENLLARKSYAKAYMDKQVRLELEPAEIRLNDGESLGIRGWIRESKLKTKRKLVEFFGSDWLYLALLGLLMGIFSFTIDVCIELLRKNHLELFRISQKVAGTAGAVLQYFVWVIFTLFLIMTSAALCQFIAPQSVGSGIPQMKTILRGVILKEYLTFRTLVAKSTGLVLALGSGLPIGKEGPFVHIASILATLLSKLVVSFKGIYQNESRSSEMLAAACAVGVAGTYGAPVGGVLFSIEVTSVFFPLRNYWRGFFATICSAIIFRLLTVWFHQENTVVAFSRTTFPSEYPFDPKELLVFAAVGILCGLGGALFILFHRRYVQFIGENKYAQWVINKNHFVYPAIVTAVIASLRCPIGYGKYFAGSLTPRETLDELFCNFSWKEPLHNSTEHQALLDHWSMDTTSVFLILSLYTFNMFWMTAVSITLPVPSGVFIPVFVTGAAFGRLIGEIMALIFPNGVRADAITHIVPGAYAIVGASAFAGSVTHAISTSVIVFEITGQIMYILPVILAVLLANATCARLQPSIYDSLIRLKRLPYLPRIPPTSSSVHRVFAEDIMVTDVKYVSLRSTYRELRELLESMPRLRSFPIVDRPSSLILLGSITRAQLEGLMEAQIGEKVRRLEAVRRQWLKSSVIRSPDKAPTFDDCSVEHVHKSSFRKYHSQDDLDAISNPLLEGTAFRQRYKSGPSETILDCNSSGFVDKGHLFNKFGSKMQTWSRRVKRTLHLPSGVTPRESIINVDLSPEERKEWEDIRMTQRLNFDLLTTDPAPFQLVEKTSLYKVHALFSLLGLNRAYVTRLGRLVGVVALRELRTALETAQGKSNERKSSTCSVEENVVFGTSLGSTLRPSRSMPVNLCSLASSNEKPIEDFARGSLSIDRMDSAHSSRFESMTAYRDDGVSLTADDLDDVDDEDEHLTAVLRKLSARNA